MVEKVIVNYTTNSVVLCYEDMVGKRQGRGKGCTETVHNPENVYATKQQIARAKKLSKMSPAPFRAVRKIVSQAA